MALDFCEHCQGYVSSENGDVLEHGYSYHKECHKCYVCSETNLHNAEVFKGVIFCSKCSQRIFQGCYTARKSRSKRDRKRSSSRPKCKRGQRIKSRKRDSELLNLQDPGQRGDDRLRERNRKKNLNTNPGLIESHYKRNEPTEQHKTNVEGKESCESHYDVDAERIESCIINVERTESHRSHMDRANSVASRVIELIRINKSKNFEKNSSHLPEESFKTLVPVIELKSQSQNTNPDIEEDGSCIIEIRNGSAEIGMTTEVTTELLRQIEGPVAANIDPNSLLNVIHYTNTKGYWKHETKNYSDLRCAELGASTEIANMALRQPDPPFTIRSGTALKQNTLEWSAVDRSDYSDESNDKATDSAYSSFSERPVGFMDRRLRSLLKMPINYIQSNIIRRSSLVSIIVNKDKNRRMKIKDRIKMKQMKREEHIDVHHRRGMKKLYPTINRLKVPYKMGWLSFNAEAIPRSGSCTSGGSISPTCRHRCEHLERSSSYRCMRNRVMKLAGPTKGELANVRAKLKRSIFPNILTSFVIRRNTPRVMMTQACGVSVTDESEYPRTVKSLHICETAV